MTEETRYDGRDLKQAYKSAESVLEKRIDEINALNVFPVPDGDTGINMFLTLQSANESVNNLTSKSASEIASKAAMGALLGARGNSGIILSQILRGIAQGLESKDEFSALDFALALQEASKLAYSSLAEPLEGTILTVIREAAEKALLQAQEGGSLKQTLRAATSQARQAVIRTPEMLPSLKEAGVVDAGGKGLFYFFQGMKNVIVQKMNTVKSYQAVRRRTRTASQPVTFGYDLQFLIEGDNLPVTEIREKVTLLGNSVLVVGDPHLIRVHVHTHSPQEVIDYCAGKGRLKDLVKDNLDVQVKNYRNGHKHRPAHKTQLSDSLILP
jgi:uncharacterized protein